MQNTGCIKTVKSSGFGFIETVSGIDFYFHFSDYKGDWKELLALYVCTSIETKIEVKFDVDTEHKKAPKAIKVELV